MNRNEIIMQLLHKLHQETPVGELKKWTAKIACGYGIVNIKITIDKPST